MGISFSDNIFFAVQWRACKSGKNGTSRGPFYTNTAKGTRGHKCMFKSCCNFARSKSKVRKSAERKKRALCALSGWPEKIVCEAFPPSSTDSSAEYSFPVVVLGCHTRVKKRLEVITTEACMRILLGMQNHGTSEEDVFPPPF